MPQPAHAGDQLRVHDHLHGLLLTDAQTLKNPELVEDPRLPPEMNVGIQLQNGVWKHVAGIWSSENVGAPPVEFRHIRGVVRHETRGVHLVQVAAPAPGAEEMSIELVLTRVVQVPEIEAFAYAQWLEFLHTSCLSRVCGRASEALSPTTKA